MRRIVVGTTSPDKLREIRRLLADLPVELVAAGELGEPPRVKESGSTFAENARLKALALSAWCGEAVLADDSGLEVEALGGAPGVHSRRFAGPEADDAERNRRLLEMLEGLPPGRRHARYVCAMALARGGRVIVEARGTLAGRIAEAPAGGAGFGYDPLFIPEGFDRTVGLLGEEVKHRISHRARAARELARKLRTLLGKHAPGPHPEGPDSQ